jgi:hypothetical protein
MRGHLEITNLDHSDEILVTNTTQILQENAHQPSKLVNTSENLAFPVFQPSRMLEFQNSPNFRDKSPETSRLLRFSR